MADRPLIDTEEIVITSGNAANELVITAAGAASVILPKSSTATITRVATSTAAATLLAANASRKKFIVMTEAGTANYVAYGSTATVTNYTMMVGANATIEDEIWTGSVSLIRASGTGSVQVTEIV